MQPKTATPPDLATAQTLDLHASCAATIDASSLSPASARSTVLPRLQVVNDLPALINDGRPRYQEARVLGAGGVGEVVQAQDNDICRPVAIKRLLPEVRSPAAIARFVDEIRTVGQLEHPNIVPIHDVGIDENGQFYFVMKYVQGETLESIIDKLRDGNAAYHRRYTFEQRAQLFLGILEAVQYAHAQGLIHRDIKPANVMVGPWGEVMVMDWGIAKRVGRAEPPAPHVPNPAPEPSTSHRMSGTALGSIIGTPLYMSPEQARGDTDRLDERSDIYSLCVLFHELLSLEHYLADKTDLNAILAGVLSVQPTHPSFLKSPNQGRVPSDLGWIAMGGLAKDPAQRYPSVGALLERLRRRLDGEIPVQCPVTFTKRVNHRFMRFADNHPVGWTLSMALITITLFVGLALSTWALWQLAS